MGGTMEGAFSWPAVVLVFRALALILVLSVLWFAIDPVWRVQRYKRLHAGVRKKINEAVRDVGSGMSSETVYSRLAVELNNLIGPLVELAAGVSPTTPFIQHLVQIVDTNAIERSLDLELLQAKYCFANNCDHLGTELHTKNAFKHQIHFKGTAASNPPHHITTIQQPEIAAVGPRPIGAGAIVGAPYPLGDPASRRFPIVIGQSHAFVEVDITDIDSQTRIICDCQQSHGPVDLKVLTGAFPPPPAVPGPPGPGPVLQGAFTLGSWPGLSRRSPSTAEKAKFCSAAISKLNGSWIEEDVVNFLKRLHKTMHSF